MFLIRRVAGFSMKPTFRNNQILIFKKTTQFKTGQIVCFKLGHLDIVKRIIYINSNNIWLQGDYFDSKTYYVLKQNIKAKLIFKSPF